MSDIATIPATGRNVRDGDNNPPLSELIAEELAREKQRTAELLASARAAALTCQQDAEKIADLIALIRAEEKAITRFREERRAPANLEVRTIDAVCGALAAPLARARDDLKDRLDVWLFDNADAQVHPTVAALGTRREIKFVIEDLPDAVEWLVKTRPGEMAQAARTIIGAALRSMGVDAAESANIPGVSVSVSAKPQVR